MRTVKDAVPLLRMLLALVWFGGCATEPSPAGSPASSLAAPTLEELEEATYDGIDDGPVRLSDGRFESPPFVEGGASRRTVGLVREIFLAGDFDLDGAEEAAAILWESSGGSGVQTYLALARRGSNGVRNVDTARIGDRVQVLDARIDGEAVALEVVQAGPNDAACCPGDHAIRRWVLAADRLEEQPVEFLGRVGLDLLEGRTWELIQLSRGEAYDGGVSITFEVDGERIAGFSGCNRFSVSAEAGEVPGSVTIGPATGTRKACPADVMLLERRFLESLGNVRSYGFLNGALRFGFVDENGADTMLFRPPTR